MPTKYLPLPGQAELKKWLTYDPKSGVVTRIADPSGNTTRLGPLEHTNGRQRVVGVGGKQYILSRTIWVIMTGADPGELEVDHADRDFMNDRWSNLRLSNRTQQMANTKIRSDNTTGYKGVRTSESGSFYARVRCRGKSIRGPSRRSASEAYEDYEALSKRIHGEFSHAESK